MKYTRYGTLSAFRAAWEPTLSLDEVRANLFFANLMGEDTVAEGYWGASVVREDGVLLSIRRGSWGMVLYHTGGGLSQLCARQVKGMRDAGYWPEQLIGPAKTVYELVRQIRNRTGHEYETRMDMRAYALTQVKYAPRVEGGFRRITGITDYLIDYDMDFQREAMHAMTREEAEAQIRELIEQERLYGWMVGNRYVSIAMKARKVPRGQFVSLVYTPPGERGKGYASACVAALSQLMLNEGNEYCGLFTDLSNPVSNFIYKRMGYGPVCDFTLYGLEGD